MTTSALRSPAAPALGRRMLNKVPEVTLYFWIIKILVHHGRRDRGRLPQRQPRASA